MGLVGFEPTTSPLSGARSNQLSYKPVCAPDRSDWRANPDTHICVWKAASGSSVILKQLNRALSARPPLLSGYDARKRCDGTRIISQRHQAWQHLFGNRRKFLECGARHADRRRLARRPDGHSQQLHSVAARIVPPPAPSESDSDQRSHLNIRMDSYLQSSMPNRSRA